MLYCQKTTVMMNTDGMSADKLLIKKRLTRKLLKKLWRHVTTGTANSVL